MLADRNKTWSLTLQHFTQLYAQRKAYGDDCAANSGFDSMANIYNVPASDRSLAPSEITTHDLCIKSLEESLAAAREHISKVPDTPNLPDPMAMLRAETQGPAQAV